MGSTWGRWPGEAFFSMCAAEVFSSEFRHGVPPTFVALLVCAPCIASISAPVCPRTSGLYSSHEPRVEQPFCHSDAKRATRESHRLEGQISRRMRASGPFGASAGFSQPRGGLVCCIACVDKTSSPRLGAVYRRSPFQANDCAFFLSTL